MRLLHVHTLELEAFFPPSLKPRYAIVSHRWHDGAGAECSFHDIQAGRNLDGPGYRKIKRFASFVRDNVRGVKYLWIDTCCIDKTNSQELQEAITAMYRWYENSAVCLALLHDVDDVAHVRQSVWFTRGWTLQELLAPRLVVFLSSKWEVLGHKVQDNFGDLALLLDRSGPQLARQLSDITGISESVMAQPERRRQLSTDERMSWISGRTTTRPEDMAYCLFGIFETSMPLIYEEGQIAAERRLRHAIVEAGDDGRVDHRDHLGTDRLQPSSNLPFTRDRAFVDRTELQQLEQHLGPDGARVALVGLGGVGKSQLAIEYCYRIRERRPGCWVLWIHASNETRYQESLRKLASDAKIPGHEDMKVEISNLVYHWLRNVRNGPWLLVLDSADDAEFLFKPPSGTEAGQERCGTSKHMQTRLDLLPVCTHGSIIVTSRYRAIATRIVDDCHLILVPAMKQENATALLSNRLGRKLGDDEVAANRLVAELDCMPLAITQAAAYIKRREPRCSIQQYLGKLDKNGTSKAKLLSNASVELRRDQEATNSIVLSWRITFDHILSVRPSAANLLSLMSFFDHQSIPEALLRIDKHGDVAAKDDGSDSADSDADEEAFGDDIATLRDYDLVSITPKGANLKMHRLVQFATQRWIESTGQYGHWLAQSINSLDLALPFSDYANWTLCEALYPHIKIVLSINLPRETREMRLQRSSILDKAALFALDKGAAWEAEKFASYSRDERQELLSEEHPDTLESLATLAAAHWYRGQYAKAEKLLVQTLELRKRVLGEEHPRTLTSMDTLASTYMRQGLHAEAERLHSQTLELRRKVHGEEHPVTVMSIANLAAAIWYQERYTEAEELNVQALDLRKKMFGEEHPETLRSMNNLAATYWDQGRHEEAHALNMQALGLRRKMLGEEHPDTLLSLNNLANMHKTHGQYVEAERLSVQTLELRRKVLGEEHPDTLSNLQNLAALYEDQGRYVEAKKLQIQVLELRRKVLGDEHVDTLISLGRLGVLCSRQCQYAEAEKLELQALELCEKTLGRAHPYTRLAHENLITTYHSQGKKTEAAGMEERLEEIMQLP